MASTNAAAATAPPGAVRGTQFEIRIGIVSGSRGAGKSTVRNALLREVGAVPRRHHRRDSDNDSDNDSNNFVVVCHRAHVVGGSHNKDDGDAVGVEQNPMNDAPKLASDETIELKGNNNDNNGATTTTTTTIRVREQVYDVDMAQEVLPMRRDTRLAVTVVPAIEQAPAGAAAYVTERWSSFDAVVAVLDGGSGKKGGSSYLSEHEMELLQLLRDLSCDKSDRPKIPLFVLLNKIDNAQDKKQAKVVKKTLAEIEKIFGVDDRAGALQSLLAGDGGDVAHPFPVCVPASALHAYTYRAGAALSLDRFGRDFDADLMARVGQEYLGSKPWKKLSREERCRRTHAILTDPAKHAEGMSDSHFDQFLAALERYLGGARRQEGLIEKQIERSLRQLSAFSSEWISYALFEAYRTQKKLLATASNPDPSLKEGTALREAFWRTFDEYQDGILARFAAAFPAKVGAVANPLQELIYYHKLAVDFAQWEGEEEKILDAMKRYVRRYLHFLIRHQHDTGGNTQWSIHANTSPLDWKIIWRSVLLLSYDRDFCDTFGREKMICQDMVLEAHQWAASGEFRGYDQHCPHGPTHKLDKTKRKPHVPRCSSCKIIFLREQPALKGGSMDCLYCGNGTVDDESLLQCPNCKCRYEAFPNLNEWLKFSYGDDNCEVKPAHPDNYRKVVHLDMPESLSDANHFGHAVYKFLEFTASLKNKKSLSSSSSSGTAAPAEDDTLDEKQETPAARKEGSDEEESSKKKVDTV